jgi:hypothetical protein
MPHYAKPHTGKTPNLDRSSLAQACILLLLQAHEHLVEHFLVLEHLLC